ncbi:hypothetical protein BGZ82_008036 [Podila clonocystis]|nr:hypothetical protein BGZ82_008036 [Podila clonocystis]
MASIKSRFDVSSPDLDHLETNKTSDDGPWFSTYSRALCHIYPKDDDDCWDAMLSSQYSRTIEDPIYNTTSSTISTAKVYSTSTVAGDTVIRPQPQPQPQSNHPYHRRHHTSPASTDAMAALSARSTTPRPSAALTLEEEKLISTAPMMSPASLSHALCSVGFNCIDYFTATRDDPEELSSSSSINRHRTPAQDGFDDSSLVAGDWAAAVCGKRTAALERKRVLSRSSSQEAVNVNNDPWFATLDRLSRWDEVAYR